MTISIPMLILLVLICLFVGGLIGWGLCYWWIQDALSSIDF